MNFIFVATEVPVTAASSSCTTKSEGQVQDRWKGNRIVVGVCITRHIIHKVYSIYVNVNVNKRKTSTSQNKKKKKK